MKLSEINTRVIEKYYQRLLKTPSVELTIGKKKNEFLTPSTVKNIHEEEVYIPNLEVASIFKTAIKSAKWNEVSQIVAPKNTGQKLF